MYHVVNGSYFSQDLRDGQQLPSILDMKPIQVGVRVDGCSRKYKQSHSLASRSLMAKMVRHLRCGNCNADLLFNWQRQKQ